MLSKNSDQQKNKKVNETRIQDLKSSEHMDLDKKDDEIEGEKGSLAEFFKNKTFVSNMVILCYDWIFILFSLYLLNFMVKYLPGDKFLNLFMLGMADVAPSFLSATFMIFLGRKTAMIILPTIIAILVPSYYILEAHEMVALCILLGIRFGMTLQYTFINYAIYEFFPPSYTTFVFGIANITSGLFCILAPIAVEKLEDPFFLVMVSAGIAAVLSIFLIPVKNQK